MTVLQTEGKIKQIITATLGALILAFVFTVLVLGRQVNSETNQKQIITILPNGLQNEASWGKELRIYNIVINDIYVEMLDYVSEEGWSYEDPFLFFSGEGSPLVIIWDEPVTSVAISYCMQEGSGQMDILYNDEYLGRIDLFSGTWIQDSWKYTLNSVKRFLKF